jgi:hypothetical protein
MGQRAKSCWQVRNARLFVAFLARFNARFYCPVFSVPAIGTHQDEVN